MGPAHYRHIDALQRIASHLRANDSPCVPCGFSYRMQENAASINRARGGTKAYYSRLYRIMEL